MLNRVLIPLLFLIFASVSQAQRTITVTSPKTGDFLGKTNQIKFSIENAKFQVKVKVKATDLLTGQTITNEKNFTPSATGSVVDSVDLNFSESVRQGVYTVEVTPLEFDNNNVQQTYTPTKVLLTSMRVLVKAPTFNSFNPLDGTFVKGDSSNNVHITADINVADAFNIDNWKVQIDGSDIPNNTGSSKIIDVAWNIKNVDKNGQHSVAIKVDDKAKNSVTKSINLTIDRTPPSSQIVAPIGSSSLPPNTDIIVSVKITDNFSNSVDVTGIDVVAKTLGGTFISRAARKSASNSGNSITWTGRIRWTSKIPNEFNLVVTAIDKAGNLATTQISKVKISGR